MFTPVETTIGSLLLHQATSNLLYQNGNILGASGYLRRVLTAPTKEVIAFFVGMAASYLPLKVLAPQMIANYPAVQITSQVAVATIAIGVLVGWGTKMSGGCTSGHMLCGLSRLSGRSTMAVATFMGTAMIAHHLVHPNLITSVCSGDVPCYTPVYPTTENTLSLIVLAALSIFAAQTVPKLIAKATTSHTTNDTKQQPADLRLPARIATQFFTGLLFALGLHISGMSNSAKVTSFFSFPVMQVWDPSLGLVLVFGVLPNLIENKLIGFKHPPSFAEKFSLPTKTFKDVDRNFIAGATAFGVGLGLAGTCPGPAALRAFFQPSWGALWIGGFWLGSRLGS